MLPLLSYASTNFSNLLAQAYVFKRHKVQAVLKQALHDRMEGQQYDPVKAAQVHTHLLCRFIFCPEAVSCTAFIVVVANVSACDFAVCKATGR